MTERWVPLNQLADETGLAVRTLQYMRAQEPGVLVTRTRGKALQYKQPDCAINIRTREAKKQANELADIDIDEAKERARKMRADADRSEMAAAKLRGDLAPVVEMDAAVERLASAVAKEVNGLRSRFTMRVIGLTTPIEAAAVLDDMARQIMSALADAASDGADDDTDDPDTLDVAA